jgi:hypothetical protein
VQLEGEGIRAGDPVAINLTNAIAMNHIPQMATLMAACAFVGSIIEGSAAWSHRSHSL